MYAKAIHDVLLGRDEMAPAGSVFELQTKKQFDELAARGAVRQATEQEIKLYRKQPDPVVTIEIPTHRELLEARAASANVEYRSNISDEKLMERVMEAEAKAAEVADALPPSNT